MSKATVINSLALMLFSAAIANSFNLPFMAGESMDAGGMGYYYNEGWSHHNEDSYAIDYNKLTGGETDNGLPIFAIASGTVQLVSYGDAPDSYGNHVEITHADGTKSHYAHLKEIYVFEGQHVEDGQIVGLLGNTGLLDKDGKRAGSHLHFVRYDISGQSVRQDFFQGSYRKCASQQSCPDVYQLNSNTDIGKGWQVTSQNSSTFSRAITNFRSQWTVIGGYPSDYIGNLTNCDGCDVQWSRPYTQNDYTTNHYSKNAYRVYFGDDPTYKVCFAYDALGGAKKCIVCLGARKATAQRRRWINGLTCFLMSVH